MKINIQELSQFRYILPIQGNLEVLEKVESMNLKLQEAEKLFLEKNELENDLDIRFDYNELDLLRKSVDILDDAGKLTLGSLSLIRKIKKEV